MKSNTYRVPVIERESELAIPWQTFATVLRGNSIIDIDELKISDEQDALKFLRSYGFDFSQNKEREVCLEVLAIATRYIERNLLPYRQYTAIPKAIMEMGPIELLICASRSPQKGTIEYDERLWACLVLKVCHAVAHARWGHDTEAHAAALTILRERISPYLVDQDDGLWIGDDQCRIPLVNFEIKANKRLSRVITKLLHKKGNLSQNIWDRIGIRFVTEDIFAAILLIRFLHTRGLFMYANALPREAKNSMVEFDEIRSMFERHSPPVEMSFLEGEEALRSSSSSTPSPSLSTSEEDPQDMVNRFSSRGFKMIKLIERIMVEVPSGRRVFFPYEIQIYTKQTMQVASSGDTQHANYTARQMQGVRERLFYFFPSVPSVPSVPSEG